MIDRLVHALIASPNDAADDVLLEALDLGNPLEKRVALGALLRRNKTRGLAGVVERFDALPPNLKSAILSRISLFGPALSDCARSLHAPRRIAAMRLIALGRLPRLGYVLLENLGAGDPPLQKAATESLVALARHAATQTRRTQSHPLSPSPGTPGEGRGEGLAPQLGTRNSELGTHSEIPPDLSTTRPLIEDLIFQVLSRHASPPLTRAALLLADHPDSPTLAILRLSRHPARPLLERRLSEPPASEHVDAWLLAASHAGPGPVRTSFAGTFAHLHDRPVLDALLRRTHWLKDAKLSACTANIMGGRWLDESSLIRELKKRPTSDIPAIANWIESTGTADVLKDLLLTRLLDKSKDDVSARLSILRLLIARPATTPTPLLKEFLSDPDERLRRLATREVARRRPVGHASTLTAALPGSPPSVTQIIGRTIADANFRTFWRRYDRLDPAVRRSAARAVTRLLPDPAKRLSALLSSGAPADRLRVLSVARETDLIEPLRPAILRALHDADPHVRSKAVITTLALNPLPHLTVIQHSLSDPNARVRANAIEVLDAARDLNLLSTLSAHLRAENNRQRANAIKAVHPLDPAAAKLELSLMLSDPRPMHRVSALWAARQTHAFHLLPATAELARHDPHPTVRRQALTTLKYATTHLRPSPSPIPQSTLRTPKSRILKGTPSAA